MVNQISADLASLAVDIGSVYPDPENVRVHNEENLSTIRYSLETFGQQQPIVVAPDGRIIAGNGRHQVAKDLGWKKIAVVRFNNGEEAAKAFGIIDNRSAEMASWDEEALLSALEESMDGGFNYSSLGFDDKFYMDLLATTDPENDLDDLLGAAEAFEEEANSDKPEKKEPPAVIADHVPFSVSLLEPQAQIVWGALRKVRKEAKERGEPMTTADALTTICQNYGEPE